MMIANLSYLSLAALAGSALAKPKSPNLEFAYSVKVASISQVPIASPFGTTACMYPLLESFDWR